MSVATITRVITGDRRASCVRVRLCAYWGRMIARTVVESQWDAVKKFWTEMLVDKIIIERHPSKIDEDGRRHYLLRAIPSQDPQQ
jgi:hypothetical protein